MSELCGVVYLFQTWADVADVAFEKVNSNQADGKANITILFAAGNHGDGAERSFDGPGHTYAHAENPPYGGIHFDEDETWGSDQSENSKRS